LNDPAVRTTYVLDTNVLLFDPNAMGVFEANDLVIPITVIEEVDRFKKDLNETGRNARLISRRLDEMRRRGSLSKGVPLDGGGTLRVQMPVAGANLPRSFGPRTNDNMILSTVLSVADKAEQRVVFVTRDTNMRIKADALGIPAEDYQHAHVEMDERYTGAGEHLVDAETIAELYRNGHLPMEAAEAREHGWYPNQFLMLRSLQSAKQTALTRYDQKRDRLQIVGRYNEGVWGIHARNKEQLYAFDLLLDSSISLVTLDGYAGTGKTLMALACGLKQVTDEQRFRRLVVSRPIFPLGRDIGFLPGSLSEKLNPWMKPIFDNLELLVGGGRDRSGNVSTPNYQALIDQNMLQVEPLTYIRGRSLPHQYLIVDEAQNLTPHEVKTVITRAGENTKVVLTGDPYQIDNPYVDATSNGLTYVVERFKENPVAGHVTLRKGERSELAELAATLL